MFQTTNGEKLYFSETGRTNWLYICGHAHPHRLTNPKARHRDETTKCYGYSVSGLSLVPIISNSFPIRRHYFLSNIFVSDWFAFILLIVTILDHLQNSSFSCWCSLCIFQRILQKEKQKMEQANTANAKLLHECGILRDRLQECSVNFLVEEEDKLTVDTSSPSDAIDLLTTSDNRIGLLLAEVSFGP
jgi:hypothetical protein